MIGEITGPETESLEQPYYDYRCYPVEGKTRIRFFDKPVGVDGRTFEHTNILLANKIEPETTFKITGIEVSYLHERDDENDKRNVLNTGYLVLMIGDKSYRVGAPLGLFNKDYAIMPIILRNEMTFSVFLNWSKPVRTKNPGKIGVILKGELYRPTM